MHSKELREKVKKDYNSIANEFSASRKNAWKEFEVFTPFLKKGMKVLDLGCGNGRLANLLTPWKAEYTGFDQSENLLKAARREHPKALFKMEDIGTLPPLKEKWDAIFMIASFHHLPPDDQKKTLVWCKTHLRPGGKLFMTNWNLWQLRFWKAWLHMLLTRNWGWKGLLIPWNHQVKRYYYAFSISELEKVLDKTGFTILIMQKGKNFVTVAQI